MAQVVFIFGNTNRKAEHSLTLDQTVSTIQIRDIKIWLLKENWPIDILPSDNVAGLRFLCMGKELKDDLPLGECGRFDRGVAMPVHVHIIKRANSEDTLLLDSLEGDQKWCCACSII